MAIEKYIKSFFHHSLVRMFFKFVMWIAIFNSLVYLFLNLFVFLPYQDLSQTPQDWGLQYEDVYLTTQQQEKIHGWYIPHNKAKQTLLFFHGNAGNISHRGESIKIFHQLTLNILIIDYRGFGQSEGQLNEQGLYKDARLAWQYLMQQKAHNPQDIIIFGRSLGAAVAIQLASEVQARALIIESAFSDLRAMAHYQLPIISALAYLKYDFDNVSTISNVQIPILQMHSPDDEIIPFSQGEKVFKAARAPKQFFNLSGDHNAGFLLSQPGYQETLRQFIDKYKI